MVVGHLTSVETIVQLDKETNLERLILLSKDGDESAFRALYDHLQRTLFAFAMTKVSRREDALDILQETFIDLWRALAKFKYLSDNQFIAFAFKILRRKLAKYYSKNISEIEFDEAYFKDNYEIHFEDHRSLRGAVDKLPEPDQNVMALRYWSEMSFRQIAEILGEETNAVKVRHHRALKKIYEILENETKNL